MFGRNILGGNCSQPPELPTNLTASSFVRWGFVNQLGWMTALLFGSILWMGLQVSTPAILGRAIDKGVADDSWSDLALYVGAVAVNFGAQALSWVIRHRLAIGVHIRTKAWIERVIGSRALHNGGGLDGTITPGDLVTYTTSDAKRVAMFIDLFGRGMAGIVAFLVVVGLMFVANAQLAATVLAGLATLLLIQASRLPKLERRETIQQRRLSEASSMAANAIGGLRVIKGVGGESEAVRRYDAHADNVVESALKAADVRAQTFALELMMPIVIAASVGWIGGHLVVDGKLSVGQLVTIAGWSIFLVTPLRIFGEIGRKWAAGMASATRIVDLINTKPVFTNDGDLVPLDTRGTIAVDAISVVSNGQPVIRSLTFDVRAGSFVGIVCDGATSKALSNALGRVIPVSTGSVCLDGIDMAAMTIDAVRSAVVVAEHDAVLFEGSLRHNLMVAKPQATDTEMFDALTAAAAEDIVELLDGGLDGAVFERGRSLSGGQRQRVAMARALLARPPVLIMVDPTSALDSYTEAEIIDRLPKERSGTTTIVFTSSPAFLASAEEVIFFNQGAIQARGNHCRLLEDSVDYRNAVLQIDDASEVRS